MIHRYATKIPVGWRATLLLPFAGCPHGSSGRVADDPLAIAYRVIRLWTVL